MEVCCKSVFFVSEWVSLELGLRFFSSCNGSTATVFFESKLFEGKYEPRCVQLICCFHNWIMTWLKWRNALPPVYPAGTVVRRSITSCPVQRIPFYDYNVLDRWRIYGDPFLGGGNINVGSPHDELKELKVQRACKSWTGDNFEPGMIWEVAILSFWYATVT